MIDLVGKVFSYTLRLPRLYKTMLASITRCNTRSHQNTSTHTVKTQWHGKCCNCYNHTRHMATPTSWSHPHITGWPHPPLPHLSLGCHCGALAGGMVSGNDLLYLQALPVFREHLLSLVELLVGAGRVVESWSGRCPAHLATTTTNKQTTINNN